MKIVSLGLVFGAVALMAAACGTAVSGIGDTSADSGTDLPTSDGGSHDAGDGGRPASTYDIGGTVIGLTGTGLVLEDNGGDDLPIAADGSFKFAKKLAAGAAFTVSIKTQPTAPSQTCSVTNSAGNVGSANVTTVVLTCVTNTFKIHANVTGVAGAGLILQNNGANDVMVAANGTYDFVTPVASGQTYVVAVRTQPTGLSQTCTVTAPSGTVAGADVTVDVACVTDSYTVGGAVAGLTGAGLVLMDNNGDDLTIPALGNAFTFGTKVISGGAYAVTIKTQPTSPTQTCAVVAGSGTVTNGNVLTVMVNCTTNKYAISGSVAGLSGTGLVLQDNNGDDLTINNNATTFAFATPIASGQPYAVTVKTQPTNNSQTCTVTSGSGNVGSADVTNVVVTCTTNKYTVGGTISGLTVNGLVLQDNGADDLAVAANATSFTFATSVASGSAHAVTVKTQPSILRCVVTNGFSTVGSANVTSVTIACGPYFSDVGPQVNVPVANLVGWTQCFAETYGNVTPIATITTACSKAKLMMACRVAGSTTLQLLSWAPRADVLFDTGTSNIPHVANGSGWYFSGAYSCGFAKAGDPINRSTCDLDNGGAVDNNLRMCIHTAANQTNVGYRCGSSVSYSAAYQQLFYQAD